MFFFIEEDLVTSEPFMEKMELLSYSLWFPWGLPTGIQWHLETEGKTTGCSQEGWVESCC